MIRRSQMGTKNHTKPRPIEKLVLTALLVLITSCAWSLDLKTVLENTKITPPARIRFHEERHNPLFKEPMVLTGYLEYLGPGRLRKVVDTPFKEAFLIDGDQIEVERNGKTRKLSLNRSKSLKAMLGGIEAILAGQADKLNSIFRYDLSGTICSWSLQLEPLSQKISRHLTKLLVTGDENSVTSIRFVLKEGEWHLMEIGDAYQEP